MSSESINFLSLADRAKVERNDYCANKYKSITAEYTERAEKFKGVFLVLTKKSS